MPLGKTIDTWIEATPTRPFIVGPLIYAGIIFASGLALKSLVHPILRIGKLPHSHDGWFLKYNFLDSKGSAVGSDYCKVYPGS